MNRNLLLTGITLAFALVSQTGMAANANTTQKGSLLIYPKIDVRNGTSTWVRMVNDSKDPVTVKCYYMDVEKHRVDFEFPLTKNQPVLFDAATGYSSTRSMNAFPQGPGYPGYGELVCFTVSDDGSALRTYNQLSGTATVADIRTGAAEYSAWSFRAVGEVADEKRIDLDGSHYDTCPAYLFGQYSPAGTPAPGKQVYGATTINISGCRQDLRQDFNWNNTKLQFDVWKYDETRLTGAYHCANSFAETTLDGVKTAPQNFSAALLKDAAYYRVQGVKSTQCTDSQNTGLVGIQTSVIPTLGAVSTELAASNTAAPVGFVEWDAASTMDAPQ